CGADLPGAEEEAPPPEPPAAPPAAPPAGRPCPSCGADPSQIQDGYCGVCGMKQPAPRDHTELAFDGVAAVSDRGRRHWRNEDAYALDVDPAGRVLAVVCDGVSTTANPDQAAQAAADGALGVLVTDERPAPVRLVEAYETACAAV